MKYIITTTGNWTSIHADKFQKQDKVILKLKFTGNLTNLFIKLDEWEKRN